MITLYIKHKITHITYYSKEKKINSNKLILHIIVKRRKSIAINSAIKPVSDLTQI